MNSASKLPLLSKAKFLLIPMGPVSILLLLSSALSLFAADWKAGTASIKITPEKPVPLVGYAARTNVFKDVDLDVYAKALALEDEQGHRAVLVTADICTVSTTVVEPICEKITAKTGLKREEIVISLSHTHSGPEVTLTPTGIQAAVSNAIVEYTGVFQQKLALAAIEAVEKLAPGKLSYGSGVAHFTMNRREFTTNGVILGVNPRGFVDRAVPVLRIDSPDGELRAVLFGYACHGTTLPSDSLTVSPEYPGYAREEIKKRFPKAESLFLAGLGGSANPYPRTGLDLAKQHGAALADEVCRVLATKLRPLHGPLTCAMDQAQLPLQQPSKEQLQQIVKDRRRSYARGSAQEYLALYEKNTPLPRTHSAPVAVWQFGPELTLVALSGEVVGEYVPLIERAIGPLNLWPAAYCNAVSGYIPTAQTLEEGGYECRGLYEGTGWYSPDTEKVLIDKITELTLRAGRPKI